MRHLLFGEKGSFGSSWHEVSYYCDCKVAFIGGEAILGLDGIK